MRHDVQDCAEFLRLPGGPTRPEVVTFYTDVVGLPMMRDYPGIFMLWAGEATAFELKFDTTPPVADETDPASAQLVPVLRSYDLAVTRARLSTAGYAPVVEHSDARADTFYVLGPDRLLTGFQWVRPEAMNPAEAHAWSRWQAGPMRLPNTGPLAAEVQHLSRIVLHASDVSRSSAFYAAAYGLDDVTVEGDSRLHSIGDTAILQISPGGAARPVPADRFDVHGAFLLRTADLDAVRTDACAAGARPVGPEVYYDVGVRIQYLSDDDGVVMGFIQRTDAGGGEEDFEAMRRLAARAVAPPS